ncbi:MAG: glycogen synthase GlgA [Planctomycetaceae bacterium]|nr:glycogen synthase GlgA [Planctomycetaceae bacterium]
MISSNKHTPDRRLRIVLAASEAVPFSKTGGLADVVGALAATLDRQGHDVVLIVPDYVPLRLANAAKLPAVTDTGLRFTISMNGRPVEGAVNWTTLPGTSVRVLMIRQPEYYDRRSPYQEMGQGFVDNCERFCFFSRAVMEVCRQMVIRPDVIHCNDWQTGLVPALLASQYAGLPGFEQTASVMTIHNMAYQGRFWHFDLPLTGMDWRYFNHHHMEAWGDLNLLKTGIAFADQVTTVSPTYAQEICTSQEGYGLEGLLRHRHADLTGILNGIDDGIWNPETDELIPHRYNRNTVSQGKMVCKKHLQQRMGLPERPEVPLFGMVSRMTDQKGFDLITGSAERLLSNDIQLAFLGTGDPHYETLLRSMAQRWPDRVSVHVGFDESLAHQIEAGSDAFLMPSRFEPCGLNQMYSLRYGTTPIVRRVGGLADSVVNLDDKPESTRIATGFVFDDYNREAFSRCVERAISCYSDQSAWKQLIHNGMSRDWSWDRSAQEYVHVYQNAISRIDGRVADGRA